MLFVKEPIFWEQLHDSVYNFLSILCIFNKLKTKKIHCLDGNRSPDINRFFFRNIISVYYNNIYIKLYIQFFHGDFFYRNFN